MATTLRATAAEFLSHRRVAVAGVSRDRRQPANYIYRRLRDEGYTVFAVNPHTEEVEGDPCHASLRNVPVSLDLVIVATPPEAAASVVEDCIELGIHRVWIHRSFGGGSFSRDAVELARSSGITLLEGGCPMMFLDPVDVPHRCMRWLLGVTGKLPEPVAPSV